MKNQNHEEEENVVCLPPCALKNFEEVLVEADNKEVLVFLDYDGTLSPIVTDPNKAYISEETRKAVLEVSTRFRTSIISGRSVDKVKNFVGLPHLFYAGSHGMDIEGPDVGISGQTTNRVKHRPEGLDQNEAAGARDELSERTAGIEGVTIEDNKFCCSVHFRNCKDPTSVDRVERIVREVSDERGLDVKRGRKVFEVRPRVSSERERERSALLAPVSLPALIVSLTDWLLASPLRLLVVVAVSGHLEQRERPGLPDERV